MADMRRRQFITLLGGAAAWPLGVHAQDRTRRVGMLSIYAESDSEVQLWKGAFISRLQELGWTTGRNILIDYRWSAGDRTLMQTYAKELVALQPDAIVASNTPPTAALLRETRTIPIVFATVTDPIGSGFVRSIARPGGNVTGFYALDSAMGAARVTCGAISFSISSHLPIRCLTPIGRRLEATRVAFA
jgi:putative tryptophan/tyrosine transport system substrate-binding protein